MIHNCQGAWYLAFEFDDGRTARGDCRTLDVFVDEGAPFHIYFVKYFDNHVKGRDQVWADIPSIQTHGFANVHLHGFVFHLDTNRPRPNDHSSELQPTMHITYTDFCLKQKK